MVTTIAKNNYIKITLRKYTQNYGNILITPIYNKKDNHVKKAHLQKNTANIHTTPFSF